MKIRKLLETLLVAGALGVSAAAAHAKDFRIFAMGGGASRFDTKTFTSSTGTDYGSDYADGSKFVVGGEVALGKIFGIEGSYAFGRNNLRLSDLSWKPAPETGYGARNHRISANLVAHAPVSFYGVRPYLTAGLEYDRFSPTSGAKDLANSVGFTGVTATLAPDDKIGFNFGAGAEVKLLRRLGLRFDVRDHVAGSPTFGLPSQSSSGATFPISGVGQNLECSAGVVFHFGK
jgi:hypothetical protein